MEKANLSARWPGAWAIIAGITSLLPLIFYFYLLPAAGSSATHALNAESFLPWMAEHGNIRLALWWVICIPFFIALISIPLALKRKLETYNPSTAQIIELTGILGFSILIIASLMLAAGELPLARAYVAAGSEAKTAIVAVYEWQRLVTALLFDVAGFFLIGMFIFLSSIAGWRSGRFPKIFNWFGLLTSILIFFFVSGYLTGIKQLGETGIGMLAFIAVPVWFVWTGIMIWQSGLN